MQYTLTILRVFLGGVFILYSISQFLDMQFPRRPIHDPIDQVDSITLVWYFYGYSQPYRVFIIVSELIVGLLLAIPRTSRIGILFYFPFALNIAVISWSFNQPFAVRVLSTFIAVSSLYLIFKERSTYKKFLL